MSYVVAGLDLSLTNSGVAIIDGENVFCYSFGYGLPKKCPERDRIERVVSIANSVMGVLRKHDVKYVGFENYAFGGHLLTMQADLAGTLKTQVYCGLKTVPVVMPVKSIRKFLMGKSTNVKKEVEKFLKSKGYTQPSNPDEFDALAVALVVDYWRNRRHLISDSDKLKMIARLDFNNTSIKTE